MNKPTFVTTIILSSFLATAVPAVASAAGASLDAAPQCDGDKHEEDTKTEKKTEKKEDQSKTKAPTTT